jgi:hypothetical protein
MWPRTGHQVSARYSHRAGWMASGFLSLPRVLPWPVPPPWILAGDFAVPGTHVGEFCGVSRCWARWRPIGRLILVDISAGVTWPLTPSDCSRSTEPSVAVVALISCSWVHQFMMTLGFGGLGSKVHPIVLQGKKSILPPWTILEV